MKLALDYTEQAKPLTMHQIKVDCDNLWAQQSVCPDKIILWQHQLDWIIKDVGADKVANKLAVGQYIWGIWLEVRK